jgi:hypothetical protein
MSRAAPKLSPVQRYFLMVLTGQGGCPDFDDGEWCYIPFTRDVRTFEALERKGLVIYRSIPDVRINGYRITAAGRAALTGV